MSNQLKYAYFSSFKLWHCGNEIDSNMRQKSKETWTEEPDIDMN